jgi:AraC-like DNA-binding protein
VLEASRLFQFPDLGDLGWAIYFAPTLNAVIETLQNSQTQAIPKFLVHQEPQLVELEFLELRPPCLAHYVAGILGCSLRGLGIPSSAISEMITPQWAALSNEESQTKWSRTFQTLFGIKVSMSGHRLKVKLKREALNLPLLAADQALFVLYKSRYLRSVPNQESNAKHKTDSAWLRQAKNFLRASLNQPSYGATELAQSLGLSKRTLERRLASEGVSFREVKQLIQAETSQELLKSGFTPKEVAFEVGFESPAAFTRAFNRWTGACPSSLSRFAHCV